MHLPHFCWRNDHLCLLNKTKLLPMVSSLLKRIVLVFWGLASCLCNSLPIYIYIYIYTWFCV